MPLKRQSSNLSIMGIHANIQSTEAFASVKRMQSNAQRTVERGFNHRSTRGHRLSAPRDDVDLCHVYGRNRI
jgi:hypothetical protein